MQFNPSTYERMKFEEEYAKGSALTIAKIHEMGLHAYPCNCGQPECKGWAMLSKETAEDKRKLGQIRPGMHVDYGSDFEKGIISIIMPGDTFIGICLQGEPDMGFTIEAALQNLEDYVWNDGHAILFPLIITMPCGNTVTYEKREDFPRKTVPCPCGSPLHTFIIIKDLVV